MPFTFSHPAAVLPFNWLSKKYVSLTGLVLGSMAPDFEYFIRLKDRSYYSHTWKGMFWFDLPLVIILAFIYHGIVRDALIDNTPLFLRKKLLRFKNFPWINYFKKNFPVIIISILIGIASHIIWDGFTHGRGRFVKEFQLLRHTFEVAGHFVPTYQILWNLGTIIGGLIVIYALLQLPTDKSITQKRNIFPYWLSVSVITLITLTIKVLVDFRFMELEDFIVPVISGWLLGLIITPKILPAKYL